MIVITGGSGFLGSHLELLLKKSKVEYKCLSSDDVDLRDEEHFLNHIVGLNEQSKIDGIIHLAAMVGGIEMNSSHPYSFIMSNLIMGLNVINAARWLKIKNLLMVGTVCAYPENTPIPFKEEDIWNGYPEPTNAPYGIAKRTLMEVLYTVQDKMNTKVLNLANLYGPGDGKNGLKNAHVIPNIIDKIVTAKKAGQLCTLLGDGFSTRDFLHVSDASRAVLLAYNSTHQGPHFGVNVGTGVETSIRQVAKFVCDYFHYPFENIVWNGELNGQRRRCLDCSKAKELFGFQSIVKFEDGLRELCDIRASQEKNMN